MGPGFEIAVRTGEGKPFDMTVDGSRRGPGRGAPRKETQGSGELERRVTAVEALLLALVQQLDEVEAKVDAALAEARKRPDVP